MGVDRRMRIREWVVAVSLSVWVWVACLFYLMVLINFGGHPLL
jgi:hypothetical protein